MVKIESLLKMRYNIAHGLVTAAQHAPNARKGTAGLPWREAASLMLVSPTPLMEDASNKGDSNIQQEKPHFLVTQRSKTSGSFSNILCFPGGNVCAADSEPSWIHKIGSGTGYNISEGITFISNAGEQPQIYNTARRKDLKHFGDLMEFDRQKVPKSVSLRITAIRETFEETGILLCKMCHVKDVNKGLGQKSVLGIGYEANVLTFEDPEELKDWQVKIRRDPNQFLTMCQELICIPDINALVEWSDWLTPNCFGMQRYDTIFYMAIMPQAYPMFTCPQEVESASWLTADQVLKDCEERKSKMITPQIYELTRLRMATMKKISQLMKIRLTLGIERWCPAYIRAKDGYLSVFPGDDLYPGDIKIDTFEPIRSMDSTLDELRDTSYRLHRIEYRSEFDFKIVIKNYKERIGHVYLD